MDRFVSAAALLPEPAASAAGRLSPGERARTEEFRLRVGQPPSFVLGGREFVLCPQPVDGDMLRTVAERAADRSLHAAEGQLCRGYLTAADGIRVGVCGRAVNGKNGPEGMRELSSVCIRIPAEVVGCAEGIWETLTAGGFSSTLIIGGPGAGKTTLLRELIRKLSRQGYRVSVADERGEIAGMGENGPGFELGGRTDVLTGFPKGRAIRMLLRSMSPCVIALDEITEREDCAAVLEAMGCGVELLATVHGENPGRLGRNEALRVLTEQGVFRRYVTVKNDGGRRVYEAGELDCTG